MNPMKTWLSFGASSKKTSEDKCSPDLSSKPFYLNEAQQEWVRDTFDKLSKEQKVGQLFCLMGGDYSPEEQQALASSYCVGGFLFRPAPGEEIKSNYEFLDEHAVVPLLKAANLEEGGSGGLSDGTFFGWPMTVGATDDLSVCEKFAKVCAVEGNSVGINWSFSPVCDLDINFRNPITNVRTFGSVSDSVAAMCGTYIKTLQENGVAACAKHYPGDGVDFRDQHLHPSYNSLSAKDWYDSYGRIYKELIDNDLLSIMVGHIVQPNVARDINPKLSFADCLPGSLSVELLEGVLRKKYGFNGVITTDATIMGGFCQAMPREKAAPASIAAGCDMLVFSTDFYEDYGYILKALESGELSEKRLDEAVLRILALKAKVCFNKKSSAEIDAKLWQQECADKSVTLVKNIQNVLPLSKEKFPKILLIPLGNDNTCDGSMTEMVSSLLKEEGFEIEVFDESTQELHGTSNLPKDRLTLYIANLETASNQTTVRINWCKKHALDSPRFVNDEPSIFVSFANPYHLQDVPRIKTYINAYSANKATITAVVQKLLGRSEFLGKSPVDAFCALEDTRI